MDLDAEAQGRLQRFGPIADPERMAKEGLQQAWFTF